MSKTILIVDHSSTVRKLFRFMLMSEGFIVKEAKNGIEALEKMSTTSDICLVLTDINMPQMDGFSLINTIRKHELYRNIPIIIISTEKSEEDIQTGLNLGANLHMAKPVEPKDVLHNIKQLLI